MDELDFKFIYNGRDSSIKLERNIQKDIYLYKIIRFTSNKRWKGWIEMDNEKIYIELNFNNIIPFARHFLKDRKNVSVKIHLYSS